MSVLRFYVALCCVCGICFFSASADPNHNDVPVVSANPSSDQDTLWIGEIFNQFYEFDSLTNLVFAGSHRFHLKANAVTSPDSLIIPTLNDDYLRNRIQKITSSIPLSYDSRVKGFIKMYALDRREQVSRMLSLTDMYFPLFEEALERRGLPHELKYLAIVESALNPNAVSKVGATGIWQIMYSTGRMLGLEINSFIDERRDPRLSTEAALEYLNRMHLLYNDWLLAIAAYNCGPGNVNKAIRRSGGKKDFWGIYDFLPTETRGYVPAFIAALYVFKDHSFWKLEPAPAGFDFYSLDTVHIYEEVLLDDISRLMGADPLHLRYLNPAVKKGLIPYTEKGYALVLPINRIHHFESIRDTAFQLSQARKALMGQKSLATAAPLLKEFPSTEGLEKISYVVKEGDQLNQIAEWFQTTPARIREWNNMYGHHVNVGQQLRIYVPIHQAAYFRKLSAARAAGNTVETDTTGVLGTLPPESQPLAAKPSPPQNTATTSAKPSNDCGCVYYRVKPGDNLWTIAKKYPGVTATQIKQVNKITDERSLKAGTLLKIII